MTLHVEFEDSGKPPQCPPNPAYPDGIDVDSSGRRLPACRVKLPKVVTTGLFIVRCDVCHKAVAITTAGRPDDPRSFTMDCKR
jgi:hypothetical protein